MAATFARPIMRRAPIPNVPFIYRFTGTALGATMWFWIMYRLKQEFPVMMGWKKPWEH